MLINDFLRPVTAVALAEIDSVGLLVDANAGFFRLLPEAVQYRPGINVAPYFLSPIFAELIAPAGSEQQPGYQGLLTVGDADGKTRSLRGAVYHGSQGLLLVAEFDIEEMERVGETAMQLSDDLARMGRELLSANRRLQLREAEIRELSLTDQLTGIANRRKLAHALALEVGRIERYGGTLALVMADIDRFKRFNDEFGHQAGDAILRGFAELIGANTRESDLAARYGGEEFVILLPQTSGAAARAYAERIRATLEQSTLLAGTRPVTASFGVSELRPGEDAELLIKRADDALYQAKRAGRNQVILITTPA